MVDIIDISVKPGKHASTPLVILIYKSLALYDSCMQEKFFIIISCYKKVCILILTATVKHSLYHSTL